MSARRSFALDLSGIALLIAAGMAACSGDVETPTGGSGGSTSGSSSGSSGAGGGCTPPDKGCDDGNPCTIDTCPVDGECSFAPAPQGSPCVIGGTEPGTCDGQGMCIGSDCPSCPMPGPCLDVTCENGQCVITPKPDGFTPDEQTPGDCQINVCLGGQLISSPDDADLPDDGSECTADTCAQGMAVSTPLPAGTACMGPSSPWLCDGAGVCVECVSDQTCPAFPFDNECRATSCQAGMCVTTFTPMGTPLSAMLQADGDCHLLVCDGQGGVNNAVDDTDVPVDNKLCTQDTCQNGVPTNPPQPPGFLCPNGAPCIFTGDCGCVSDADCDFPETCGGSGAPGVCGCSLMTCASLGKTCGGANLGCAMFANCDTGTKDGAETDIDCGGPVSACPTRCGLGKKCSVGSDCASGFCADGVCCDTACAGSCSACTAAKKGSGQDGACGFVASGADPDNECPASAVSTCGTTGLCNGSGACQLYPAGTVCAAPSCSGTSAVNKADTCDGAGACVDNGAMSCYPFVCSNNACLTSCVNNSQCAGALTCVNGMCVIVDGPCSSNAQCASGFCVDGVCCNTACVGLCKACSFAKKGTFPDGVCGNISAGLDPDNECAGAMTCNGAGACQ